MVHGIGSIQDTQVKNKRDYDESVDFLIKGGYLQTDYTFESVMIDWKTMTDASQERSRSKKC